MIRDLLYADDCALLAHSEADAQHLFDRFYTAASSFGLTISLKKTEVMLQPHNRSSFISPSITAGDVKLPVVDKFCYLGCILTSDAKADEDINSRIAKASAAVSVHQGSDLSPTNEFICDPEIRRVDGSVQQQPRMYRRSAPPGPRVVVVVVLSK